MKIMLDYPRIKEKARAIGCKTAKELCANAGVNLNHFYHEKYRQANAPLRMVYLLANYLECAMEDIIIVDWEK